MLLKLLFVPAAHTEPYLHIVVANQDTLRFHVAAERKVAVVQPCVLATLRSATWHSSSSAAQTAQPVERLEGEVAPRPEDKGRAIAPPTARLAVDETLPKAAGHVQPQALTGQRRR